MNIPTGTESYRRLNPHLFKAELAPTKPMTIAETTDVSKLNKTEKAYYEHLKSCGKFKFVSAQALTLKLADDCRLTPDFFTIDFEGNGQLIDVKGFQREDALIKMKVAARQNPWAKFLIVKRDGAGWSEREVKP